MQDAFDRDKCNSSLAEHGKYVAGGNFFWQDFLWTPTPNVPLEIDRVRELGRHAFESGPTHLPWMLHLRVPRADYPVEQHRGNLERVSPEETAHATLLSCAADIAKKCEPTADDPLARRWRTVLLSVTCCFEVISQESEVYWRAQALRQQIVADYAGMKRTARQTAHEIANFKKMMESTGGTPLSAKDISQMFAEKGRRVSSAGNDDQFTATFVQSALAVYDTICLDKNLVRYLQYLESNFGLQSCLNSITKLYDIVRKTNTTEVREWVLGGIVDLIQDKKIRNEDVSRAVIVGGNHSTGLVQMLLLKQRLLQFFLSKDCAKAGFDHDDLQMIRAALSSRDSYRSSVSALPGGQEPDVSWIGRLRESSVKVLRLLEAPQIKQK